MLYDSIVLVGSLNHLFPFINVMRGRFFNVHIFAGLTSPYSLQGMPVIGGCNCNSINRLIIICFSEILFNLYLFAILLFKFISTLLKNIHIRITQSRYFYICRLRKIHDFFIMGNSPAINSKYSNPYSIIGSFNAFGNYLRHRYFSF